MLAAAQVLSVDSTNDDGYYTVGSAITIEVVFDKNVLVGGQPTLKLETGTTDRLATFDGAQGSILRFVYRPQRGDATTDLDYFSTSALDTTGVVILATDGSGAANVTLPAPGAAASLGFNREIVIDTEAPTPPTVNRLTTAQKKPTLTGEATLGAGEKLTVTVNGITFSSASPGAITYDGTKKTWNLDTAYAAPVSGTFNDLADGTYPVTATVIDAAGNTTNDATTNELTVDTTPPSAPGVNPLVTSNRKPTIGGTATLAVGDKLSVVLNGVTVENVPVAGGKWSLNTAAATTFTDLDDGTYDVVATVTDVLGNSVSDGTPGDLVIDNAAPTILSVTSSTADGPYKAGSKIAIQVIFTEAVTVVTTLGSPTLALNAAPGRVATYDAVNSSGNILAFDYTVVSGDNTPDLDYDSASALVLKGATIRDAAGNDAKLALNYASGKGDLANNKAIVIDTKAPATPSVTKKTYNSTLPTIEGTATLDPGDSLTVIVNGATYDNVAVTSGKWSIDTSSLAPTSGTLGPFVSGSNYSVTATVTDAAGNVTSDTTFNEISINTTVPAIPTVVKLLTNKVKPTITGTATLVGTQKLSVVVGAATYNNVPVIAGSWSLDTDAVTPSSGTLSLSGGIYPVTATVADDAGNSATDISTGELTVDVTKPTVVNVTSPTADGAYNAGKTITIRVVLGERVTVDTALGTPTLTLNTTPARSATYNAVIPPGNAIEFTYLVQDDDNTADLDYASTSALNLNGATIKDDAGNDADLTLVAPGAANSLGANKAIVIDTEAPTPAPTVTRKAYNTNLPTIEGTATLVDGDTLTVVVNGATYANVEAPGGTWEIDTATLEPTSGTLGGFASGATYSVTATVTDAAGNSEKDSTFNEITINTTVPPIPTVDTLLTNKVKPTITGTATLAAGQTLTVTVNGFEFSSATPGNFVFNGTIWSLDTATATPKTASFTDLPNGTYNVVAVVSDTAGNSATDISTGELTVDVTKPTVVNVTSPTADGAYNAGKTISIRVAFSEPVTVDATLGIPTLALNAAAGRVALYDAANTSGNIVAFEYTVFAGDNNGDLDYDSTTALKLNGATIKDDAGNDAVTTLASPGAANSLGANKSIVIDTDAPTPAPTVDELTTLVKLPTITGTAPALGTGERLSVEIRDNTNINVLASYDHVAVLAGKWSVNTDLTPTKAGGFLTPLASGFYSVVATVTDAAGNEKSDGTFKELVISAGVQMVTSTLADGTYGVGTIIPISVLFSDPVKVETALIAPTLSLGTTPVRTAEFVGPATLGRVLVFDYVVQPGDSATDLDYTATGLTLNFATIRDASGIDASLALPAPGSTWSLGGTKNIAIDTLAPNVAPTVNPLTTNVVKPTLTGTATLDAGETLSVTVNGYEFSSARPNTFTFNGTNWSLNTATAPSTPAGFTNLTDGTYEVVAKVSDAAGNFLTNAPPNELVIDTVRPTVTITSDSTTLAIGQTAQITFALSEPSAASPDDFATGDETETGGILGAITQIDPVTYTATFTPTLSSTANGTVRVTANKFKDVAGNWNVASTLVPPITVDTVAPTITITSNRYLLNGTQTATITFTLSEPATDFGTGDAIPTGGTLGPITGSGRTYTATFTPTGAGAGNVTVAANRFTDPLGNPNLAGALDATIAIDAVAPTVVITSDRSTLNGTQTAVITFTLSEPSTNFVTGDAVATGGLLGPIVGSGTVYKATFTPNPSPSATGSVTVAAGVFTDAAGNPNTAGALFPPMQIDTVAPRVTPTVTRQTTNNPKPIITGTATLAAGETLSVTINNATNVTFPVTDFSGNRWSLNTAMVIPSAGGPFTGLTDGTYNVTATVADIAGNAIIDLTSSELVIDTGSPTVVITSSSASLKAGETAEITFRLSEPSSNFATGDAVATGGVLEPFIKVDDFTYTAKFTPTAAFTGNGTVLVAGGAFTDAAGNNNVAGTLSPVIEIDTQAPLVAITSSTPTLKADQTATITFTLSESVVGFTADDLVVVGGTVSPLSGAGTVYSVLFTPSPSPGATATVSIPDGAFTDQAGNRNAAASISLLVDTVQPTFTSIVSDKQVLKSGETAKITFTLSEPVVGFTASDVTVTGGTLSPLSGSGAVYTAVFTPAPSPGASGKVAVAAGGFTDTVGNGNKAGSLVAPITIDTVVPVVSTLTSLVPNGTYGVLQTVEMALVFSEPVFVTGTPTILLNTTPARFASYVRGSGTSSLVFAYTIQPEDASPRLNHAATTALTLNGGSIRDAAGNDAALALPDPASAAALAGTSSVVVDGAIRVTAPGFGTTLNSATVVKKAVTTIKLEFNAPVDGLSLRSFRLYYRNRSLSLRGASIRGSGTSWQIVLPRTATSLRGNYRLEIGGPGSGIICNGVPVSASLALFWQRR